MSTTRNTAVIATVVAVVLTNPTIRSKTARALHRLAKFLDPAAVAPLRPMPMWSDDETEEDIKEFINEMNRENAEPPNPDEVLEENLKNIRKRKLSLKDFQNPD